MKRLQKLPTTKLTRVKRTRQKHRVKERGFELVKALRQPIMHPFNDEALDKITRDLSHTMMIATKRPKDSDGTTFSPKAKLDTSMIEDRRKNPPIKLNHRAKAKQRRIILSHRGAFAGQNDLERPSPRVAKVRASGSMTGDGRLERPAPHGPDKQYVGPRDAGSQYEKRTKPKKKKPIINQGRHDA